MAAATLLRGISSRCCMVLSTLMLVAYPQRVLTETYIVSPSGDTGFTLSEAMGIVGPGDTIELKDGIYEEHLKSVSGGEEGNPIRIVGGLGAVINPHADNGYSRAVQIFHSYIHIIGFSVDGFHGPDEVLESYIDKCVWIDGLFEDEINPIEGFVMQDMFIHSCGSECVRLKNFVTGAIIQNNTIEGCGIWDYRFGNEGKNGEGIYTGTSSKQWEHGEDQCNFNYITGNTIETSGNECVDIKEGSSGNVVEYNVCRNQLDEKSGCFNSRGDVNTFRFNDAMDCLGAGIRLGGHVVDGRLYGQSNNVYGNMIVNPEFSGIKVEAENQGLICGNTCQDGDCRVTGEESELIGGVAFEECGSEELDAALEAEPPLQGDPTPSPVVSTTTDETSSSGSTSLIQTSIIITRFANDDQEDDEVHDQDDNEDNNQDDDEDNDQDDDDD